MVSGSGPPLKCLITDAWRPEYRRYRTMEAAANKLQREAKGYLDALRGM
jgi:hypothetical protein